MGIMSWIIMGLIVGVVAKFIMPGKDPDCSRKNKAVNSGY
jgi:uncharacterized membrane protein YeaQ/YmgE (transglycosylase-associated protein family)